MLKLKRLLALAALPVYAFAADYWMFVGTYTSKGAKGIYAAKFHSHTGKVDPPTVAVETANPSFLAIHPNRRFLYAAGEGQGGTVSAFAIDAKTGKLTLLNSKPSAGNGPCFVTVDATGTNALVANYGSGSLAVLPIDKDGKLGDPTSVIQHKGSSVDKGRQGGPHAHSINLSPDNRFAIAADLGLDEVLVYKFDPKAHTITPNEPPFVKTPPGSGPRHFSFHPNGKYAYVIEEMGNSVTGFQWDAKRGVLTTIETVTTLPSDFKDKSYCAEVLVHPNGKYLYGSNRGHNSIAVFRISDDGKLTAVEHVSTQGKFPRNFRIDPTGSYLFAENQDSANVVGFRIDKSTGKLTPNGVNLEIPAPVCIKFLPAK